MAAPPSERPAGSNPRLLIGLERVCFFANNPALPLQVLKPRIRTCWVVHSEPPSGCGVFGRNTTPLLGLFEISSPRAFGPSGSISQKALQRGCISTNTPSPRAVLDRSHQMPTWPISTTRFESEKSIQGSSIHSSVPIGQYIMDDFSASIFPPYRKRPNLQISWDSFNITWAYVAVKK